MDPDSIREDGEVNKEGRVTQSENVMWKKGSSYSMKRSKCYLKKYVICYKFIKTATERQRDLFLFFLFIDGEVIPEHYRRSKDLYEIDLDHPLRELVYRCLEDDPKDRPTALGLVNELSEHKNNNEFQRSQDSLHRKQTIHRMPADKYDYEFKLVLVGDTAVGKTSIATRFVQPDIEFQERRPMTWRIGDLYNARFQLKGKSVLLQIVDTSGQLNVTSSLPQFYRGAHGAAVVFDVASRDSLVSVRQWVSMVREKCGNEIPIILVGNKTDRKRRDVNADTAENVRDKFNLFYIEVSAKTGENIDETFSVLTEQLMQQRDLGTAGASATSVTVHQLPSTSSHRSRYYEPAKITAKEPTKRKRIAEDPDSISLTTANEEPVSGVPITTKYGSINTSSAKETSRTKKRSCCF